MNKKIIMENLTCTGCTGRIESELRKLTYVKSASFNFNTQTMLLDVTEEFDDYESTIQVKNIVDSIETGIYTYMSSNKDNRLKIWVIKIEKVQIIS